MPTPELDDDCFPEDLEMEFDDDPSEEFEQAAIADDLFSEVPNGVAATEGLHGEFEGDLRKGLDGAHRNRWCHREVIPAV